MRRWQMTITLGLGLSLAGCSEAPPPPPSPPLAPIEADPNATFSYYDVDPNSIVFRDQVTSQTAPAEDFTAVALTTAAGESTTLKELAQGKTLIAVFTRGYNGAICPYCSSQTARLIKNYAEFQKRNAEIVVIYPLGTPEQTPKLGNFLARVNGINANAADTTAPFPLLVDIGLKAVDVLGIRKDLSKPATYILDGTGAIRFAYVGESLADRPSIKALLDQLDSLKADTQVN